MITMENIIGYCEEAFRKAGYDFSEFNIIVGFNNRLTKTLGRCISEKKYDKWYPTALEFSNQLRDTMTIESVKDIVFHECAHALTCIETGEVHGHDAIFKAMCNRIMCVNDGVIARKIERTVSEDSLSKYVVKCPICGTIGRYSRMGKVLKNLDKCTCGRCGGGSLYYIQNW